MEAFLFPGQGSQKKGMGRELFDEVHEFHERESEIDKILGYSLRRLCLEDPCGTLNQTQYTQPALFVVNVLHYSKLKAEGRTPNYLAGHSLGEYAALFAAGAFGLIDGVRLVKKRSELMAESRGGGMAAVIGLSAERVGVVMDTEGLAGLDIANYNAPSQVVVSGPLKEIDRAEKVLRAAGAQFVIRLPVSAAFHSRYMTAASHAYAAFLADFHFAKLQVPVVSNVTGRPYAADEDIRSLLTRQLYSPVRWVASVHFLISQGVTRFTEVGPGVVLSKLVQQVQQNAALAAARDPSSSHV